DRSGRMLRAHVGGPARLSAMRVFLTNGATGTTIPARASADIALRTSGYEWRLRHACPANGSTPEARNVRAVAACLGTRRVARAVQPGVCAAKSERSRRGDLVRPVGGE